MAQEGFKRKLTAILSADVEGYSRLMGEDEEATASKCLYKSSRQLWVGRVSGTRLTCWELNSIIRLKINPHHF